MNTFVCTKAAAKYAYESEITIYNNNKCNNKITNKDNHTLRNISNHQRDIAA